MAPHAPTQFPHCWTHSLPKESPPWKAAEPPHPTQSLPGQVSLQGAGLCRPHHAICPWRNVSRAALSGTGTPVHLACPSSMLAAAAHQLRVLFPLTHALWGSILRAPRKPPGAEATTRHACGSVHVSTSARRREGSERCRHCEWPVRAGKQGCRSSRKFSCYTTVTTVQSPLHEGVGRGEGEKS